MPTITGTSSANLQADFMKLFVTQLQNQNPLEPMDSSDMTAQLAQLSQLEQLENMNSSFARILSAQQMSQATAMLGKEVLFTPEGSDVAYYGPVDSVDLIDGQIVLNVGQYRVPVEDVQSIK